MYFGERKHDRILLKSCFDLFSSVARWVCGWWVAMHDDGDEEKQKNRKERKKQKTANGGQSIILLFFSTFCSTGP